MIDPERYFPPGPASDCELARVSRGAALSAVVREELTGGCVLYRPLWLARRPSTATTPEGAEPSTRVARSKVQVPAEVRLGSGVFHVRQICRPDQKD
jgi:hypothetical protein